MAIRIGETIPNLTVPTDEGPFALHDWIGDQWAIIFSHRRISPPSAPRNSAQWLS